MLPLSYDSSGLRRAHTCLFLPKQLAGKRRCPSPLLPLEGLGFSPTWLETVGLQGLSVPSEQGHGWGMKLERQRTDCSRHSFRLIPMSLSGKQRGESNICTSQQVPAACPLGPLQSRQGQRVLGGRVSMSTVSPCASLSSSDLTKPAALPEAALGGFWTSKRETSTLTTRSWESF